ncbi:MAG TPA: hypothetical protein PK358_13810 [Spirochaetota bacterium]|nr:hypothetical protein [Spirochaetota bacterium]HPJ35909.1 hypothetical protein [Spirochaetota bacterium]
MNKKIKMISLLLFTVILFINSCSNPFRTKSQCEILCEQMHGECNQSCPHDRYDPACHEKCDNYRNCAETCNKPLFSVEEDEEKKDESGGDDKDK